MASEWALNIDLIRYLDRIVAVFWLLNPGRSQSWKLVCPVLGGVYQDLLSLISEFFAPGDGESAQLQRDALDRFISLAGATFNLDDLLGKAKFSQNDALALSTLATAIPWDLLPYDGGCLRQKLGIGLQIPAPPSRVRPRMVDTGSSRPQFLHVIANPRHDLLHAAAEADALRGLVERQPELEYRWLQDPTPDELASELGKCKRPTPYFHFTGHVKPGRGLELKNGILSCEELTKYFPGNSNQIVMLNGCDALWERSAGGVDQSDGLTKSTAGMDAIDVYQSAGVAGAFLEGGAGAVIAPRSRVIDRDAKVAAEIVWERVFAGDGLGHVVRQVGQRLSGADCALQSGYSYVLYGAPSTRARQRAAGVAPISAIGQPDQPVLLEACGDAGGAAEPRHIFAALSRRWIIGQAYFERERNRYIETVELLRQALRVSAAPSPAKSVELSPAAERVLELVADRPKGPRLDELALLEALTQVNDLEVQCALEGLGRWPRRLDVLLQVSREWIAAGANIPEAAFHPDGHANFEVLLPDLFRGSAQLTGTFQAVGPSVGVWDLFVAVIAAGGNAARLWQKWGASLGQSLVPPIGAWQPRQPLHWRSLTAPLQRVMTNAFAMSLEEAAQHVGEGQLISCVASNNAFEWSELPAGARRWLDSKEIDEDGWTRFLERLSQESLGWL